jgi:hypothetical protein
MDVIIFPGFIEKDTCNQLNDWVDLGVKNKWLDLGISRNSGWKYNKRVTTRNYGNRFDYPPLVHQVFNKITNKLELQDLPKSVTGAGKDGVVVSCTFPGGDVYPHKDPKEGELEVLRCNIMTRNSDDGGELFIGGKKINVGVGDLHCYLPSDTEHYVTEVKGQTPRIMWMFGYQIAKEKWQRKIESFYVH